MTRGRSVALTPGRLQLTFTNYTWSSAPLQFSPMPLYYGFYYRFIHGRRQTNFFWPPYSCFWLFNLTQIWVRSMLVYPWKCMFLSLFCPLKCRVLSIFSPEEGMVKIKGGWKIASNLSVSSIHKTCLIFLKSIFVSSVLSPFPPLGHKRAEIEFSGGAVVASEIDLGSCLTISACHPDNKQMIKAMWQELLLTNMTKGRNTNADGFLPACTSDRFEVVTHNLELSSQQWHTWTSTDDQQRPRQTSKIASVCVFDK